MEWESFLKPEVLWIIAGLVLIMLEFMVPGIVIIFFGFGAILTGLVCIFADITFIPQILIFVIASIASLLLLRKQLKKIFVGREMSADDTDFEAAEYKGKTAMVLEDIAAGKIGKVEFQGSDWSAKPSCDVAKGDTVSIVGQEGLTLFVEKAE